MAKGYNRMSMAASTEVLQYLKLRGLKRLNRLKKNRLSYNKQFKSKMRGISINSYLTNISWTWNN